MDKQSAMVVNMFARRSTVELMLNGTGIGIEAECRWRRHNIERSHRRSLMGLERRAVIC